MWHKQYKRESRMASFEDIWARSEQLRESLNTEGHIQNTDWEAAFSVLVIAFVATHARVRSKYAPSVPKEQLDHELIEWLHQHLASQLKELPDTIVNVPMEKMPIVEALVGLHAHMIRQLLALGPEDWPLLYR